MLTQGAIAVDVQPWPRGASAGRVVADHVRALGLRPEDSFGVLPDGGELVFVYRDRREYEGARGGLALEPHEAAIMDMFDLGSPGTAPFVYHLPWSSAGDYLQTVGVRPGDAYGFFPAGDALCFAYRDRPEYAAGRERPRSAGATAGPLLEERPMPQLERLAQVMESISLAPEDCYGLGFDAASAELWLATAGRGARSAT